MSPVVAIEGSFREVRGREEIFTVEAGGPVGEARVKPLDYGVRV